MSLMPKYPLPNLAADRETLLTGLSPSRAMAFKSHYAQAYREHHRQFHDDLLGSQATLITTKKKAAAFGLFNTVIELGAPVEMHLEEELATLAAGPAP